MMCICMCSVGLNTASSLLTQPQTQVILAQQMLANQVQQSAAAVPAPSPASIPVQQILIPVSTPSGAQQLLSIPISMATAASGGAIQLLTTSNGQLVASNLAQPISFALPSTGSVHYTLPVLVVFFLNITYAIPII